MVPWDAIAALVGGGLNSLVNQPQQYELPPELRKLYAFIFNHAKGLSQYGHSAPLSAPQERLALAEARGQLGAEQRHAREGMAASFSANNLANLPDFLANQSGRETAQLQSVDQEHLLAALQNRFQARMGAGQAAAGAIGAVQYRPTGSPPMDLSALFGQLGYGLAYSQRRAGTAQATSSGLNTQGLQLPGNWAGPDPSESGPNPDPYQAAPVYG